MDTPRYVCNKCSSQCDGKPWITISLSEQTFKACSYLCYNYCRKNTLPRNHYDLIVNKEDFTLPRPYSYKNDKIQEFTILTETEINQLSDEQYSQYKEDMSNYYMFSPPDINMTQTLTKDEYNELDDTDYSDKDSDISIDDY